MMWAGLNSKNSTPFSQSENRYKKKPSKYSVIQPLMERTPPCIEFENLWTNIYQAVGPNVVYTLSDQQWVELYQNIHKSLNQTPNLTADQIHQRIRQLKSYRQQLQELHKVPKLQQRSDEWYAQRRRMLTASDLASVVNKNHYASRRSILEKKVEEIKGTGGFKFSAPALKWGVMYEAVALRCYLGKRANIVCHEFGLIPHPNPEVPFGASPDGITEHGIMVELKCPYSRVIQHGVVPENYYLQIQGQLEVCNLDECDYVECTIEEFQTTTQYLQSLEKSEQHGSVLEWVNEQTKEVSYEYSKLGLSGLEVVEWSEHHAEQRMDEEPEYQLAAIHYWQLKDMNLVRVYRDRELWKTIEPEIKTFWSEVEMYRASGTLPPKMTRTKSKEPKKMKIEFRKDEEDEEQSGV